jgi:hypothetical protein
MVTQHPDNITLYVHCLCCLMYNPVLQRAVFIRSHSIITALKENSDPTVTQPAQNGVTDILRWQWQQLQNRGCRQIIFPRIHIRTRNPKLISVFWGFLQKLHPDTENSCPDQNGVHWWNFVCTVTKISILLHTLGQFLDKLTLNRETARACCAGCFLGNKLKSVTLHTRSSQQCNPTQNYLFSKNSTGHFKTASLTKLVTHKNMSLLA